MTIIGRLNYQITADTSGFTQGMVVTKKELRTVNDIYRQTRTPAEQYSNALQQLGDLHRKGAIDQDTYKRALRQTKLEYLQSRGPLGRMVAGLARMNPVALAAGAGLAVATTAVAAFAVAMRKASKEIGEQFEKIDEIAKASDMSGFLTETIVSVRRAAALTAGASETEVDKAMQVFSRRIGEVRLGTGEAKRVLESFGLTADELASMPVDAALQKFADEFSKLPTAVDKAAAANLMFGRSGAKLIPLLSQGGSALDEFRRQAEDLGISFSAEQADAVEKFNDAIGDIKRSVEGFWRRLAIQIAPDLADFAETIKGILGAEFQDAALSQAIELYDSLKNALIELMDTIQPLLGWWQSLNNLQLENMKLQKALKDAAGIEDKGLDAYIAKLERSNENIDKMIASLDDAKKKREMLDDLPQIEVFAEDAPEPIPDEVLDSQLELADAVDKVRKSLEEQIATFGMSRNAAELWKLQQQGATEAQIEEVRALQQRLSLLEHNEEARKKAAEMEKDLLDIAKKTRDDELKEAKRAREQLQKEADAIRDKLKTPEQQFQEHLLRMAEMMRAGMLTLAEFTAERARAAEELAKPIEVNFETIGVQRITAAQADLLRQTAATRAQARDNALQVPDAPPEVQQAVTGALLAEGARWMQGMFTRPAATTQQALGIGGRPFGRDAFDPNELISGAPEEDREVLEAIFRNMAQEMERIAVSTEAMAAREPIDVQEIRRPM